MRPIRPLAPAALLLSTLLLAGAAPALAATASETFEATYPFAPGDELAIDNVNGSIEVEAWDRDEVRVEAEKKVKASSRERAEEALAELTVEVRESPGRLEISTESPRGTDGFLAWLTGRQIQGSVHYRLLVPRDVQLDARTVNGRVHAEGTAGDLRFRSTNGRIEVVDAAGSVRASTTNGSIDVELARVDEGAELDFSTTNGSIRLEVPADLAADLRASTTNGSISTDLPIVVDGRVSKRRLEGTINGGGGRVRLSTTNGSIRIVER